MKHSSVGVIIPTTGNVLLKDALESVVNQTYTNLICYVVVDGEKNKEKVLTILSSIVYNTIFKVIVVPDPTGINNFNGHRIYAATTYLLNTDYVAFLDEDNWWDANHISSIMSGLNSSDTFQWGHSLRKIYDADQLICNDNCENLGQYPTCLSDSDRLVDVSSYIIERRLAVSLTPYWFRQARAPGILPADRTICKELLDSGLLPYNSAEYSLNYRVASRSDSVQKEFFIMNNKEMKKKYNGNFPWTVPSKI